MTLLLLAAVLIKLTKTFEAKLSFFFFLNTISEPFITYSKHPDQPNVETLFLQW